MKKESLSSLNINRVGNVFNNTILVKHFNYLIMKITRYFLSILLFSFFSSCNNETDININESPDESLMTFLGYEIESVTKHNQAKEDISKFNINIKGTELDFSNSMKVNYKDLSIDVIITPLISEKKSSEERYFLYYIENSVVSDINMYFSKTTIDESTASYSFFTPGNDLLFSFNVNPEGLLSNLELGVFKNTKGFWSEYTDCVGMAITEISKEPIVALACMYWGPYCAGGIAFMCLGAAK
jgi:hypothetical protein